MTRELFDTIFARRSIRRYTVEPVSDEHVKLLLEAGMAAPSANNRQPWHFVVVTDRETLNKMAQVHPYARMLAQATLAIAVCGDAANDFWQQDCSAATENILLAATALGLGSVWVGCYPKLEREEAIRRVLGVPAEFAILNVLAIGHPAEERAPGTKYDESKIHFQKW